MVGMVLYGVTALVWLHQTHKYAGYLRTRFGGRQFSIGGTMANERRIRHCKVCGGIINTHAHDVEKCFCQEPTEPDPEPVKWKLTKKEQEILRIAGIKLDPEECEP